MKSIFSLLAFTVVFAIQCPTVRTAEQQPNIVLIVADDLGWSDTAVYGSEFYKTPAVDALAAEGMRFTNAYSSSPLCSPTRAALLTGLYPGRIGLTTPNCHIPDVILEASLPKQAGPESKTVTPIPVSRLSNEYVTIAERLKEAGYATAFMGKWHLGSDPYVPENQGFDVVVGGRENPGPPPPGFFFAPWNLDTLPQSPEGTHIDDVLGDAAVDFIEKNKDQPFFLDLWFYDVHAPFMAKQDLRDEFVELADQSAPQHSPTMAAMISTMDANIARVMAKLKELGLTENTLVIFTSDNGGNMYDEVDGTTPTNNAPLRNGKGNSYEGGVRVPFIAVWPGRIEPGSVDDTITSSIDVFPTLLQVAGLERDPAHPLDGESILPVLDGGDIPARPYFDYFPHNVVATENVAGTSVRDGDWKLFRYFNDGPEQEDRFELYNLADDIGETKNLASSEPERVKRMDAMIDEHHADIGALVPFANPNYGRDLGAGWVVTVDADLAPDGDVWRMTATGKDAGMETGDVPDVTGEVRLEFELKSNSSGDLQVFYRSTGKAAFKGEVTSVQMAHSGEWEPVGATFNVNGQLRGLRIDPSQALGEIEIRNLRLVAADGALIKEWSAE